MYLLMSYLWKCCKATNERKTHAGSAIFTCRRRDRLEERTSYDVVMDAKWKREVVSKQDYVSRNRNK